MRKLKNVLGMLKGSNIWDSLENYCIAGIVGGAGLMSAGLGLSAVTEKGISALLAMVGGFVMFVSTAILIFSWVIKEMK